MEVVIIVFLDFLLICLSFFQHLAAYIEDTFICKYLKHTDFIHSFIERHYIYCLKCCSWLLCCIVFLYVNWKKTWKFSLLSTHLWPGNYWHPFLRLFRRYCLFKKANKQTKKNHHIRSIKSSMFLLLPDMFNFLHRFQ